MSLLEIYIPAYDRPEELDRLLKSIPPIEGVTVTVADDSGTSRHESTAAGYGSSYVPRRYNMGRDANLLIAVAETKAEWLWVIGDDDWLLPGGLEAVLNEIGKDRADRIITYSEAADARIAADIRDIAWSDAEAITKLRADPTLLIAATLCSANVFRTSTLDLAEGMRHMDTYYPYAYASLSASRWVILPYSTIGVGTKHAVGVPDVLQIWQDYLDAMCAEAGVPQIPVRDAARWNFVSVEGKAV